MFNFLLGKGNLETSNETQEQQQQPKKITTNISSMVGKMKHDVNPLVADRYASLESLSNHDSRNIMRDCVVFVDCDNGEKLRRIIEKRIRDINTQFKDAIHRTFDNENNSMGPVKTLIGDTKHQLNEYIKKLEEVFEIDPIACQVSVKTSYVTDNNQANIVNGRITQINLPKKEFTIEYKIKLRENENYKDTDIKTKVHFDRLCVGNSDINDPNSRQECDMYIINRPETQVEVQPEPVNTDVIEQPEPENQTGGNSKNKSRQFRSDTSTPICD